MPTPPASATSRKPRRLEDSAGVREGRKYSASISRTMVTTSTDNWVSARSGAERAKARATSRPATLRINSDQAHTMEQRRGQAAEGQHQHAQGGDTVQRVRPRAGQPRQRCQLDRHHDQRRAQQPGQVALQ